MSAEECRIAFKASLELLEEKCGLKIGGRVLRLEEMKTAIRIPPEVVETLSSNPELTREERIESIATSSWARGYAEGVCRWVTGEAKPECVERLARQVAEKVVS